MRNTKTEITGRNYLSCTGASGRFEMGEIVKIEVNYIGVEGEVISGVRYAPIERIAKGREAGMYGETALVQLSTQETGTILIAARLMAKDDRKMWPHYLAS
jgi:hypothetical protein